MTAPLAYNLADAADSVGYSIGHLRRAIHTTNLDPSKGVHHLPAKKDTRGQYRITVAALTTWLDQMQDA